MQLIASSSVCIVDSFMLIFFCCLIFRSVASIKVCVAEAAMAVVRDTLGCFGLHREESSSPWEQSSIPSRQELVDILCSKLEML